MVEAAAAQMTVSFFATLAAASASSAVLADPTDITSKIMKRVDDGQCAVQTSSDDTTANFLANSAFAEAANGAMTPPGWRLA